MNDLERQFEEGREIQETSQTLGHKLLKERTEQKIRSLESSLKRHVQESIKGVENPNVYVQELVRLQSLIEGLTYFIRETEYSIEKMEKANKKLS